VWNWRITRARRARFEAELVPHLGALYRFACTLKAADEAEDLVQITCARALEYHASYRPDSNARAWLFTILRNELVSRRRRLERERSLEAERALLDADAKAESVELLLLDQRWADEIRTALASLAERYRTPVYLKDVEGFSYREIAAVLHCPLGTVMSRLARGRTLLRALLLQQATERGYVRADAIGGGKRSDTPGRRRKESM
jgi:RNA polymerase sigma-70 factor (ECF subfamily)